MSGQRRFMIDNLSSSEDDTSSEDFHYTSSEEQRGSTPPSHGNHLYYDEGSERSEIEEESMDYEGRDTILPVSEYRTATILPPLGHKFSHMGKLQIFKNPILLDQSDIRPQTFGLHGFLPGDDDEDYDIDVEDDFRNSSSPDGGQDDNRNSIPRDDGGNENIVDEEAGGAIEVEEPFISQPIAVLKPCKLALFEEDEKISFDDSFPQGFEIHRSFRVGWGPNGSLVIPRRANFEKKKREDMEEETYERPITISKIQVFNNAHTTVQLHPLPEANPKKQDFTNEIFLLEKHLFYSQKKKGK